MNQISKNSCCLALTNQAPPLENCCISQFLFYDLLKLRFGIDLMENYSPTQIIGDSF